jgi:branched-chain amino acid transport system ATP-binding protein
MVALGRALMARPKLLLLDEPSLGIAPILVHQIFASLAELKQTGVTMLLVEQNMTVALDLADRAYVLRTGEVSLEGPAADLKDNYEEVAAAYLGARR